MTTATIVLPYRAGRHEVFADEHVDKRGFARARRTETGHGLARSQIGRERFDALALKRGHGMNRYTYRHCFNLGYIGSEVVDQIALVQNDDRLCAAFVGERDIALDAPWIEVTIHPHDDEHGGDIRRDDLRVGRGSRR